jgi:hypothetical protein
MPGPDDQIDVPAAPAAAVTAPATESPAPQTGVDAVPAQPDPAPAPASTDEGSPASVEATAAPEHPATLLDKFDEKEKVPAPAAEPAKVEEVKTEEKPAEAVPDPNAPAAEQQPEPAPSPLEPIDYFAAEGGVKLPETLTLSDEQRGDVATSFDAFRADPKAGAQALVDLHNKFIGQAMEHIASEQWRVFREMTTDWAKLTMADPVIGGAGHDTAMEKIARVRDRLASTAPEGSEQRTKEIAELNTLLRVTGVGNHPALLRLLHNAAPFIREARIPVADGKVPKTNGAAPKTGKLRYDNPTSQQT